MNPEMLIPLYLIVASLGMGEMAWGDDNSCDEPTCPQEETGNAHGEEAPCDSDDDCVVTHPGDMESQLTDGTTSLIGKDLRTFGAGFIILSGVMALGALGTAIARVGLFGEFPGAMLIAHGLYFAIGLPLLITGVVREKRAVLHLHHPGDDLHAFTSKAKRKETAFFAAGFTMLGLGAGATAALVAVLATADYYGGVWLAGVSIFGTLSTWLLTCGISSVVAGVSYHRFNTSKKRVMVAPSIGPAPDGAVLGLSGTF